MSDPNKVTYFGFTDFRNEQKRFGIKNKDRARHMYVIGKTGMGKSTLLENIAAQDIQNGEGVCFIDPHGSAIETLLEYIPEHRIQDVVYFAPFDSEYPIAFNVMEDVDPSKRHLVASGLMSTFKKIWVDAWSARMEYILNNTILALLEYPGTTLLSVNRMLSDKGFRDEVVRNVKDPSVRSFWVDEFANYTERMQAESVPAIQNKIGQFTSNPIIRNIIGQKKSSFNVRDMMDNKKIFLINLSKGQIGEQNAALLGGMIITAIYLGAMSRADVHKSDLVKLPNFYLFVDEFQNFANDSFADILAEARKYKLSLTVAHQYIAQMEESVADAVFGNVGTTISYRVGPMDAEVLEKIFSPTFVQEDIVNLGRFQFYLSLMIDEVGSKPFSATGIPPLPKPERSFVSDIIDSSRGQFAVPREVIDKSIQDWHSQEFKTNRDFKKAQKFAKKISQRKDGDSNDSQDKNIEKNNKTKIIIPDSIKKTFSEYKKGDTSQKDSKNTGTNNSTQKPKKDIKNRTDKKFNPKNIQTITGSVAELVGFDSKKKQPSISKKEPTLKNKNTLKEALSKALGSSISTKNVSEKKNDTFVFKKPSKQKSAQAEKKDVHVGTMELLDMAERVLQKHSEERYVHQNSFTTFHEPQKQNDAVKEIPEDVLRSILS